VTGQGSSNIELVEGFVQALDDGDDDAAAALLAEDAELVYPGETVHGRDAWRQGRAAQERSAQLSERVEDVSLAESGSTVEMTARLVQRWTETGEIAHEHPIRVRFALADGSIERLEFLPGP
jgi:ketosteroid isomerase-like protein